MEIWAKKLSPEGFAKYGRYCDMLAQGTDGQSAYFADRLVISPHEAVGASVGYACPCEMKIPWFESHMGTAEMRMPMDGDMVIYLAENTGSQTDIEVEAFIVPQGTMVYLNPGVVHGRQFPLGEKPVHVLLLSEAETWANDVNHWQIDESERILIKIPE